MGDTNSGEWASIRLLITEFFVQAGLPEPYMGYRTCQRSFGVLESPHNLLPSARADDLRTGVTVFFFFSKAPVSLQHLDFILAFPDFEEDVFTLTPSKLSNQDKVHLGELPKRFVFSSVAELASAIHTKVFG